MSRWMPRAAFAAAFVCTISAITTPARAGLDVSFGANVPIGDDANLFFSISSRYFDRDVAVVRDWGTRYYRDPDDLAVALYVDRYCHKGPEFYVSLRKQGLGWFDIATNRCHVDPDVFFVPVERDPGPPYGRAYGYWKKHKRDPRATYVLKDADVRNLVAVRIAHEYYGVPVETAMQWRRDRGNVRKVMVREYRGRHDDKDRGDRGKRESKGKGHGKGKGHH